MKNLSILLGIAMFSLFGDQLLAQGHYRLNPENANKISDEIYDVYGNYFNASSAQIQTFLESLIQPDEFNQEVGSTLLQVSSINDESINLGWKTVANADGYRVSYFNLKNLDQSSLDVPNSDLQYNELELANMADGFYVLAIVANESDGVVVESGLVDIIIIEKKAFIVLGDMARQCDCNEATLIYSSISTELGFSELTIDWDPVLADQHVLRIDYVDGRPSAFFNFTPIKNFFSENIFAFEVNCMGNVWPGASIFDNTVFAYDVFNPLSIHMDTESYAWELNHDEPVMQSVSLKRCPGRWSAGARGEESIALNKVETNLFPNPASDAIELNLNIDSEIANATLEVFNQSGMQMLTQKNISRNTVLNIEQFPAGSYFMKIKTDQGITIKRFQKI